MSSGTVKIFLLFYLAFWWKLLYLWYMKLITVQEYAKKEGICLAAAYKRVKLGSVDSERKYGKLLVKLKTK